MSAPAPVESDRIEFLSLVKAPQRRRVLVGSKQIRHPAGTVAYLPDQPDYAAVVVHGLARMFVASAGGRQATVYYFHRGELVGTGVVVKSPVKVHVQAVTDVEVTSLDVNLLRDLACRDIDISSALLTNFAALAAHCARIIAVRSFGDITERLAFDLLDRACSTQLLSGRLVVRASQQQLADSIGTVREVVTRSLRKLRDERVVTTATNLVRVLDVEKLERIANHGAPV